METASLTLNYPSGIGCLVLGIGCLVLHVGARFRGLEEFHVRGETGDGEMGNR